MVSLVTGYHTSETASNRKIIQYLVKLILSFTLASEVRRSQALGLSSVGLLAINVKLDVNCYTTG